MGHGNVVQVLLVAGANVNHQDKVSRHKARDGLTETT